MSRKTQILTAFGTFSVALGIGFVMQNGDALAGRFSDEAPAPQALSTPLAAVMPQMAVGGLPVELTNPAALPVTALNIPETARQPERSLLLPVEVAVAMPEDAAAPSFAVEEVMLAAAEMTGSVTDLTPATPSEPTVAPSCDATLQAVVAPAALVELTLQAPCAPDAHVVMHHQGLMFTVLTDATGQAQVLVPALAEVAVFVAELDGGSGAAATAMVPDLASYDRAVLQWQGLGGMQLHALEFGASYADAGHIWSGAPGDATLADGGTGGFITRLGNDSAEMAMMAEVYTFPTAMAAQAGMVDLSVEAEVTAANCDHNLSAQSIQIMRGQEPSVMDMTLTMPDCTAVGEFLLLDTMLQDLVVAAR